ncbi:hypothetical protein BDV27DRAFT_63429 [Aspergillus caelatus]|uniref:Uncharacterized protein n=1 Tax=Aspergillus caelatus TaxID=61420 RepID=A0A5N6ZN50_9EURO|nr:uncharacterized protein BDV27DRAFT_63429 [Aspergillus caelatus]KAE8358808.1 hypothetical protein BDV27DRAFT_63429 [Aspergillus caelatus]
MEGVYTVRRSEMSSCGRQICTWWMSGSDVVTIFGGGEREEVACLIFFFFPISFSFSLLRSVFSPSFGPRHNSSGIAEHTSSHFVSYRRKERVPRIIGAQTFHCPL